MGEAVILQKTSDGSGGGLDIILRAKGTEGAAVEAALDGKTYKGTVGEQGFVDIPLKELGAYSVKVSKDEYTYTQTVNVYQYGITECWALANKPFVDCTPEEIQAIAKAGMASKYWQRGDRHKITMKTNEEIYVVIADFDHDVRTDGNNKIPLTLVMENCFNTTYRMNASNTNVGGWENCEFRTSTLPNILSNFPDEWQQVMTVCQKKTSMGNVNSAIGMTDDTLFLLSEVEVYGTVKYSFPGEGTLYPIFTDDASRARTSNGSPVNAWERSPCKSSSSAGFCCISSVSGAANGDYAGDRAAKAAQGVFVGFCVG